MSRSGLKAWHNADCAWCDKKATGDAKYTTEYFASCGKHGEDFQEWGAE